MNIDSNKIKIIFIGTPDFSIPSFKSLITDDDFDIISVVTQPDRKAGRKQIMVSPPVKIEAEKNSIPVFQPDKIIDIKDEIFDLKPDLIIVIAYAQIIPESILEIPKYGVVNVHGSILPKYRGASCVQAAILNGDKKTGVTIMKMDKGLDTGPILTHDEISVSENDTGGSLYSALSELGAKILAPTIKKYINGTIKPVSQDNDEASYVGLLKKKDGEIDWAKNADEIKRHTRAMFPWPGAFTKIDNKNLKILEVENLIPDINDKEVGVLFLDNDKLLVQCGRGSLVIDKLQIEGKKEMSSKDFILGYKKYINLKLG